MSHATYNTLTEISHNIYPQSEPLALTLSFVQPHYHRRCGALQNTQTLTVNAYEAGGASRRCRSPSSCLSLREETFFCLLISFAKIFLFSSLSNNIRCLCNNFSLLECRLSAAFFFFSFLVVFFTLLNARVSSLFAFPIRHNFLHRVGNDVLRLCQPPL